MRTTHPSQYSVNSGLSFDPSISNQPSGEEIIAVKSILMLPIALPCRTSTPFFRIYDFGVSN